MGVAAVIVSDATDAELVERALVSVLYQTYPVDEIVVVEAKRRITNDLEEMIHGMDSRIVLEHYHCYNASMARNHGATLCHSEFICFLDGDDEWSPHMIEDRMALVDDGICMVTSKYACMTGKNGRLKRFMPTIPNGTELFGSNLIGSNSYVMMRRGLFLKLGGFDPKLVYHQDWDLWIRMLKHGRVAISPMLGGIRYYNPFSASKSKIVCREGWIGFARKWAHVYRHEPECTESIARLYADDMSRFDEPKYMVRGPFGLIRRKFLNRLPSWMNLDFYRDRSDRDRVMSLEEVEHLRSISEKGTEDNTSKVVYMMHPLFKGKRIRPRRGHV